MLAFAGRLLLVALLACGLASGSAGADGHDPESKTVAAHIAAPPTTTTLPATPRTVALQARSSSRAPVGSAAAWGSALATKAAGDVPIGPVAEKAHKVADRVAARGAPLPGYKGGRAFENRGPGMKLPGSGPNGSITYREWDVNPYTKGVNRGSERLVMGSDGSAYYTTNHYDTFTRFR